MLDTTYKADSKKKETIRETRRAARNAINIFKIINL